MNAKARLQALEAALRERGVVDVKFFFTNTNVALSTIATDAADALQAVVEGRTRPFAGLNDHHAAA
ncbi:hypothetical protein ACQKIE_10090 [Luteibacter sp. NPDC031894]|uniref:hypothetical protein n=1 Tax=Luteibacter sp. NPDC031894 TaxID=3390572 RepID=UPI003CFCD5FB